MADPIQIEYMFQEVMDRLEITASIRHRYYLFRKFAESLDGTYKKYESYLIQLLAELPLYNSPLTWSGLDPDKIEQDIEVLNNIHSSIDLEGSFQKYRQVKQRLEVICLLLYSCLNEADKVSHYFQQLTGKEIEIDSDQTQKRIVEQLIDTVRKVSHKEGDIEQNQQSVFNFLENQISFFLNKNSGEVLIPVAERYVKTDDTEVAYGRLRKMKVDIYGRTESKTEDELIWNSNIYGADPLSFINSRNPVLASRKLFKSEVNDKNYVYYKGGIQFEMASALHNGNSANFAIAALWYTHLLKVSGQRERYSIIPQTMITGDIDKDGSARPVDKTSIHLKVKAAFFSWSNVFVAPADQSSLFHKEIQKLNQKYPNKTLDLIAVDNLKEIFYDRRVASHELENRFTFYFKRLKNQKYRVVTVFLVLVLLGIIGWLVFGPIDKNPVAAEFQGSFLNLNNEPAPKSTFSFLSVKVATGQDIIFESYMFRT